MVCIDSMASLLNENTRWKYDRTAGVLHNWRFSASYDNFYIICTLVTRLKFCG